MTLPPNPEMGSMSTQEKRENDGIIRVGKKEASIYVTSVLNTLTNTGKVQILARGDNINKAIEVAEKVKRMGAIDTVTKTRTEEFDGEDERTKEKRRIRVSAIEINLVIPPKSGQ